MAHEIDFSNQRANMAYVGEKPWHGLGTELDQGADLDQWRISAGLDWHVEKTPIMYQAGDEIITSSDTNILYRDDTRAKLGVCANGYRVVQPADILDFYRELTARQGFTLETAGSLRGGKRIWALARTEREFAVMGQDVMKAYMLLATSYDGTLSTVASFTSVRVVCQNTLSFAVGAEGEKADIRIPHHAAFNADSVKRDLGLDTSWSQFEQDATQLAERKVSRKEATEFFMQLVYGEGAAELAEADLKNGKRKMTALLSVYEGGVGQNTRSAQGTAWGLVNAVTRYTDHERNARSTDTRMNNAWFGAGAKDKRTAFDAAMKLAA